MVVIIEEENDENEFKSEIDKFTFLVEQGYIEDKNQLKLFAQLFDITVMPEIATLNGYNISLPAIIIAKPIAFKEIQDEIPEAKPADPYMKMFPKVSLLSLEKAVASLANLKIPYDNFSIVLHKSYRHADIRIRRLLYEISKILNENGYAVKYVNTATADNNLESMPLPAEFDKIICHLKKMLKIERNCDDTEWWKFNFFAYNSNVKKADMALIETIASKLNLPIIAVKYIVEAYLNNNNNLLNYAAVFNLSNETVKRILSEYGVRA